MTYWPCATELFCKSNNVSFRCNYLCPSMQIYLGYRASEYLTTVDLVPGTLLLAAYITLFQTSFCVMDRAGIDRHTRCQMGVLKGLVEQRKLGRKTIPLLMAGTTMNHGRGVGCRWNKPCKSSCFRSAWLRIWDEFLYDEFRVKSGKDVNREIDRQGNKNSWKLHDVVLV